MQLPRGHNGSPAFLHRDVSCCRPHSGISNGSWWMIVPMEAGEITMAMTAAERVRAVPGAPTPA
jgi:hypothetical protein